MGEVRKSEQRELTGFYLEQRAESATERYMPLHRVHDALSYTSMSV
jgi:hypothetical protein